MDWRLLTPSLIQTYVVSGSLARPSDSVHADRYDEAIISKMSSRVRIMIFPTIEELMIARDTRDLVFGG